MHAFQFLFCTLFLSHHFVAADDPVFSGPQPGEKFSPFKVLQFSGPRAGEELELLAGDKTTPTVLVFVHEATRPGLQLMRPIDLYGAKLAMEGCATHFVWLTADRSKAEDYLRNARNSLNLKSPISISLDGVEGPGNYGLNRKVALTIVVAKDNKVVANFAIVQPNETDAPKVLAQMAKLMGKEAPTLEELRTELGVGMRRDTVRPVAQANPRPAENRPSGDPAEPMRRLEEEVARLRNLDQEHHARAIARIVELEKLAAGLTDALNEARAKIAKLEGKPAPEPIQKLAPRTDAATEPRKDEPKKKAGAELPGRTPSDPELVGLMRRLIQPSNDEATVKEISEAMHKWAGDSPQRKTDIKEFAVRIAHLGYGSESAKAAIKKLAATQ